jgi:hypothetical protein
MLGTRVAFETERGLKLVGIGSVRSQPNELEV